MFLTMSWANVSFCPQSKSDSSSINRLQVGQCQPSDGDVYCIGQGLPFLWGTLLVWKIFLINCGI